MGRILQQLREHNALQVRANVELNGDDRQVGEPPIDHRRDFEQDVGEADDAVIGEMLELGRNQHVLRRRQRRDGGDVDRRRRVDDDLVVAIFEGASPLARLSGSLTAPAHRIRARRAGRRRRSRSSSSPPTPDRPGDRRKPGERSLPSARRRRPGPTGVALGIEVDDQHAAASTGQFGRQIDGCRRLADAALAVCDGDDPGGHLAPFAAESVARPSGGWPSRRLAFACIAHRDVGGRLARSRGGVGRFHLGKRGEERVEARRVEMTTAFSFENRQRAGDRKRLLVGPLGRQSVEDVGDRDDARA